MINSRNKSTKEENIDGFKIKYKKHIFSKSIKVSLKSENEILVTLPKYCPYKNAEEFLKNNFEKIKNFEFKKTNLSKNLKTKFDTLKIIESNILKTEVKNKIVYFYYPDYMDFNSKKIQTELKSAYKKAIQTEAKNYLPFRIRFLADKYGFEFNKLTLRNQKTRFGSCSFVNNINLNINLMNYDFDIIDYVLIHELVHTKVKNHSKTFWNEVEKYCPNYKELRKRLKTGK